MLDETQELQLIRSVLVEAFPQESRRVGKTNLNDIVRRRGQVRVVPLDASRLEWVDSLLLLAHSAALLSHWLIAARNNIDSKERGKTEWHIHFEQTNRVDSVQASEVKLSNALDLPIPLELAGKLDSAALDRLTSLFVAHLDAVREQGSDSREPE
jgi:hypothetical protein